MKDCTPEIILLCATLTSIVTIVTFLYNLVWILRTGFLLRKLDESWTGSCEGSSLYWTLFISLILDVFAFMLCFLRFVCVCCIPRPSDPMFMLMFLLVWILVLLYSSDGRCETIFNDQVGVLMGNSSGFVPSKHWRKRFNSMIESCGDQTMADKFCRRGHKWNVAFFIAFVTADIIYC